MRTSPLFDVSGKVALVTGGAQGLGRMMADALVGAGMRTLITSRRQEILDRAVAELGANGTCEGIVVDLAGPEGADALVRAVAERTDRLHVLVNNAGRSWGEKLETFPARAWAGVFAVNVQIPFHLARDLLPLLERAGTARDPARVINIGSVAGRVVEPIDAFSYSASKAGLHHLTRLLAAELAARHVNVNVLVPGYFPTQMTAHVRADEDALSGTLSRIPMGRLGSAEDIAGMLLFLSSRASAYVTGAELALDGGMSGCR